ncbi:hypothetical protein [Candidatus Thiothrix anitrata]|jgi:hypothetical protein|uniref:DUF3311 domain-containing protein n=1 Tax=Candidatus Thiothrix anitrata TaxID=2823902 RepID=A0ABX7X6K5_9GAMM|nr:hypothetical protein [Candidatus Thiothrix anitrata]QTR51012.1 hypothetical protein J8380_05460 [Candidatus Thiothrix anitrata]
MLKGIHSQRLFTLFILGWSLLNFPLLALWDHQAMLCGVPLFPAGLFLIWTVLIIALAWLMETRE